MAYSEFSRENHFFYLRQDTESGSVQKKQKYPAKIGGRKNQDQMNLLVNIIFINLFHIQTNKIIKI